ncbi:MAG: ion transporter [Candidatus Euphemobacter frigidus]|nr:ion transporter [Candidatus Euphemobacter frigidus]MDP8276467.1 ion transporter [Candidatus Euphemobacter frigidus]
MRDKTNLRSRLHEIIFEADTPAGKAFDVGLIICILVSVAVVMIDSVREVDESCGGFLYGAEWFFTIVFAVEYGLRLYSIGRPLKYATSFYGIVDLLAILPTPLSLFFPGSQYLLVIRVLRVLRIFRVFKLGQFIVEANILYRALRGSLRKIAIFLLALFTLVIIFGSLMYLIEGEDHGFTSIPRSIYWAIVTLTTVGYGDISPGTSLGQAVAAVVMILGYSIIAVPTGIFTVEFVKAQKGQISTQVCPQCSAEGHDPDAVYCKRCGTKL